MTEFIAIVVFLCLAILSLGKALTAQSRRQDALQKQITDLSESLAALTAVGAAGLELHKNANERMNIISERVTMLNQRVNHNL